MRTLVIIDTFGDSPLSYVIVDGAELNHLNRKHINGITSSSQDEKEIEQLIFETEDCLEIRKDAIDLVDHFPVVESDMMIIVTGICY